MKFICIKLRVRNIYRRVNYRSAAPNFAKIEREKTNLVSNFDLVLIVATNKEMYIDRRKKQHGLNEPNFQTVLSRSTSQYIHRNFAQSPFYDRK